MSTPLCSRCGQPLRQLVSLASDAHDEPAWYCGCWPFDWQVALMQVVIIASIIGLFWCIGTVLP